MSTAASSGDLFFNSLIQGYVEQNTRFVRRDWLAKQLDQKLAEPGKHFVLLAAAPGAGKSTFMAQLAHDHPDWLRYFIRRDQREVLADVSRKSFLLRIGYQLAARHPELFSHEQIRISVSQRIGQVMDDGEVLGAEVRRLIASPFYQKILEIQQHVQMTSGQVIGLRIDELVVDPQLISEEDLFHLAIINPARVLERIAPGNRVVVLIDALDEIRYHQTTENVLTWLTHCQELPDSIRFVLAARPPDETLKVFITKQSSRLCQLTIAEDDPVVHAEIEQYVNAWINEPAITHALRHVDANLEVFGSNAIGKAHGSLGYVDALTRALDQAVGRNDTILMRKLLDMTALPTNLEGLYAFFLNQIKASVVRDRIELKDSQTDEIYDKPVWPAVYAPILGVLAVVMEPVSLDLLLRLSKIRTERVYVSDALDRLQQFLEVRDGRYRLYHATVAEFLTDIQTSLNLDTIALYQDAVSWHRQIAEHYWQVRDDWSKCDAYGLRNLAGHLECGNNVMRLHQLISHSWMRARVVAEGYRYSGFISDLMRAWERVYKEAIREIDLDDEKFSSFATCIKYALIRASMSSLSSNYPVALITQALNMHVWSIERGLDMCMIEKNEQRCAELYLSVLQTDQNFRSNSQRLHTEQAAMTAARSVVVPERRAQIFAALASHLSGASKMIAVDEVLTAVQQILKKDTRVKVLVSLAPQLSETQLGDVLAAVQQLDNERARAEALASLIPHLSDAHVGEALAATKHMYFEWKRTKVLEALAPHFSDTYLREVLDIAEQIRIENHRVEALVALAVLLSGAKKTKAIAAAFTAAQRIEEYQGQVEAWTSLATLLSGSERRTAIEKAFTAAQRIEDYEGQIEAWTSLAPLLSGSEQITVLKAALGAAQHIKDEEERVNLLVTMAAKLHGDVKVMVVGEALAAAWQIERYGRRHRRADALTALAPHLSESQVGEALAAAQLIEDESFLGEALAALASRLSGIQKTEVLSAVLALVQEMAHDGRGGEMTEVLVALAPHLSVMQVLELLAIVKQMKTHERRCRVLWALALQLRGDAQTTLLNDALTAGQQIAEGWRRAKVLAGLTVRLNEPQKRRAVGEALAVVKQFGEDHTTIVILRMLAPQLSETEKEEVLIALQQIKFEGVRAKALADLAPFFSETQIKNALAVARELEDTGSRVEAMVAMATKLSGKEQASVVMEALDAAGEIKDDEGRVAALSSLASLLSGTKKIITLGKAIIAAEQIQNKVRRAKALATLAPLLHGAQQGLVVRKALGALQQSAEWVVTDEVLMLLAPHLSGIQLGKVLADVQNIESEAIRAKVLAVLIPYLSEAQRERVRIVARSTSDLNAQLTILVALAMIDNSIALMRDIRHCLLKSVECRDLNWTRAGLLGFIRDFSGIRVRILGTETIAAIAQHISEIGARWRWV